MLLSQRGRVLVRVISVYASQNTDKKNPSTPIFRGAANRFATHCTGHRRCILKLGRSDDAGTHLEEQPPEPSRPRCGT